MNCELIDKMSLSPKTELSIARALANCHVSQLGMLILENSLSFPMWTCRHYNE